MHNTVHVLHRNIRPDNILLDKDYNIKLGDFGLTSYAGNAKHFTNFGINEYIAPEMLKCLAHNEKYDVWCLGIVVFWMLAGGVTPFIRDVIKFEQNSKML